MNRLRRFDEAPEPRLRPEEQSARRGSPGRGELLPLALVVVGGTLLGALVLLRILARIEGEVTELAPVGTPIAAASLAEEIAFAEEHIAWLAAPERRGRDTPSAGLLASQVWVARAFAEHGLTPVDLPLAGAAGKGPLAAALADQGLPAYALPFRASAVNFGRTPLRMPSATCTLSLDGAPPLVLGEDLLPLADPAYAGRAEGELVVVGYGIHSTSEGYDDLEGLELAGKIAVIVAGEPAIEGRFEGAEESAEASVWNKLDALADAGAAGALVVRAADDPGPFAFEAGDASWVPPSFDRVRDGLPALLVTAAVGETLLGGPVADFEAAIARSGSPPDRPAAAGTTPRRARLVSGANEVDRWLANVGARLDGRARRAGRDPGPAVLVGAHLDHIGVGPRGRIGYGADDNASGAAALLVALDRLAADPPEQDVWFVGFTGEEDGLMGSRSLARAIRARRPGTVGLCVNLDMIGRGPSAGVVVFRGAPDEAALGTLDARIAAAAERTDAHGLTSVRVVDDRSFFQRSDHYAFHETGVPNVFLFEDWPLKQGIYHTWRDTPETVDAAKVVRTARFAEQLVRGRGAEPLGR